MSSAEEDEFSDEVSVNTVIGDSSEQKLQHCVKFQINLGDFRCAEIAFNTLSVDPEPPRSQVKRHLSHEECFLVAQFEADNLTKLRTAVRSFMDHIILVEGSLSEFGPPLPLLSNEITRHF